MIVSLIQLKSSSYWPSYYQPKASRFRTSTSRVVSCYTFNNQWIATNSVGDNPEWTSLNVNKIHVYAFIFQFINSCIIRSSTNLLVDTSRPWLVVRSNLSQSNSIFGSTSRRNTYNFNIILLIDTINYLSNLSFW